MSTKRTTTTTTTTTTTGGQLGFSLGALVSQTKPVCLPAPSVRQFRLCVRPTPACPVHPGPPCARTPSPCVSIYDFRLSKPSLCPSVSFKDLCPFVHHFLRRACISVAVAIFGSMFDQTLWAEGNVEILKCHLVSQS